MPIGKPDGLSDIAGADAVAEIHQRRKRQLARPHNRVRFERAGNKAKHGGDEVVPTGDCLGVHGQMGRVPRVVPVIG